MKKGIIFLVLVVLLVGILLAGCGEPPVSQAKFQQFQTKTEGQFTAQGARIGEAERVVKTIPDMAKDITTIKNDRDTDKAVQLVQDQLKAEKADRQSDALKAQLDALKAKDAELEKDIAEIENELKDINQSPQYPPSYPPSYQSQIFRAEVYNGENFDQYIGSFQESTIDHDWGSGGPAGLTDYFSVRWESISPDIWFESGNYQFKVRVDDGVRLYLDGQLIIDKWLTHAATTYQVERYLSQGYHNIRLEYFERAGQAVIRLSWQLKS
ncbi:MAG: PA14 domain-containing protein [Candidatus Berkelbacteria bacterium]|nr:PA14 domain-containing protein [Candidatus Berkelbacteria bacterium]